MGKVSLKNEASDKIFDTWELLNPKYYDRALGATYLLGLWEGISRSDGAAFA